MRKLIYGMNLTLDGYPTPPRRRMNSRATGGTRRRWCFSSTIDKVDWNTRLVRRDAIAEIARLKPEDGGPMRAGGATLAAATNFDEL